MGKYVLLEKAILWTTVHNGGRDGLKVGAAAVMDEMVSFGYNHLTLDRLYDVPEIMNDRTTRLRHTVHAEADCLNNSFFQVKEMYVNYMPCMDCAKKIVASKVAKVTVLRCDNEAIAARWQASWDEARALFASNGVQLEEVEL